MNKLEKLHEKLRSGAGLKSSGPKPAPAKAPRPAPIKTEKRPAATYPKPETEYITDPDRAAAVIAGLPAGTVMGFDIETMKNPDFKNHPRAGLCPHLSQIRLVQVCPDPSIVYVFDTMKMGMDALMGLWTHKLAAHNAVFEIKHLYHAGIVLERMDCTLLQHNALYGGRLSLKDIASEYMKTDISKDEQKSDWSAPELSDAQIQYAALDAWVVQIACAQFNKEISKKGREGIYDLMREVQYAVAKMEYYGMNFDAVAHTELVSQWKEALEGAEKALRNVVGPGVSLSSNKQLSDFYKTHLDEKSLRRWNTTETGNLCLDKDTVKKFGHLKIVAPLAEYKRLSKCISSFGESLLEHINPRTGRLHPSFLIAGADTGRFSCSKPNVQQTPRDKTFRKLFKAPEGRVVVVADYSQIELRVLAILSGDPSMLEAYEKGEDLHKLTASKVSGIPLDEVTDEHRTMAKAINFGLVYGMGARGLAEYARATFGVAMSIKKAEEASDAYFQTYPRVKAWQERVTRASKIYDRAVTRTGRVVKLCSRGIYTRSKNIPVQGSAAEIMLAALQILNRIITEQELDIKIICNVHDEIHMEAPENLAEQARTLLEECMVAGMLAIFPEASTKNLVEARIAKSWGDAK